MIMADIGGYMNKLINALFLCILIGAALHASDLTPGDKFAVAIEKGDLAAVQALVEGGSKADTLIEYGEHKITPLMKACWDGEMDIAKYLLDQGANVNATDDQGWTPLSNAVNRDRADFAQLLIDHGAKVNFKDTREFTPAAQAAAAGNVEVVKILAKAGADLTAETMGLTPLMFAVSAGKEDMVRTLVELGAPVNQSPKKANVGSTALFSAIYAGKPDMVKLLIDLKANVNVRTKDGDTPLKAAQKGDQTDIIEILKAAGAKE
jgi:ankyrin repeat protein